MESAELDDDFFADAGAEEVDIEELAAQEAEEREKVFAEIKKRCASARIEFRDVESTEEWDDPSLVVVMPNGREKREIRIISAEEGQRLLDGEFEKYVFLARYKAVCSYAEGVIHAVIAPLRGNLMGILRRRLFNLDGVDAFKADSFEMVIETRGPERSHGRNIQMRMGNAAFKTFFEGRNLLTMTINGIQAHTHDSAVEVLETVSDALFFEIDGLCGVPVGIVRERGPRTRSPRIGKPVGLDLFFPESRFESEPASLYWYARGATELPLLQFLAYYQSIEYYFPVYSRREAVRLVQNLLKDPSFRVHQESDIARLLTTVRGSRAGGFGDEKLQLRATLQECLNPQELRAFLSAVDERKQFYISGWAEVSAVKIPVSSSEPDLRTSVADRMYDIRCKIVHMKSDSGSGEVDLLLPFSKEADLLTFDTELAQYVSRQVLIAASSSLGL